MRLWNRVRANDEPARGGRQMRYGMHLASRSAVDSLTLTQTGPILFVALRDVARKPSLETSHFDIGYVCIEIKSYASGAGQIPTRQPHMTAAARARPVSHGAPALQQAGGARRHEAPRAHCPGPTTGAERDRGRHGTERHQRPVHVPPRAQSGRKPMSIPHYDCSNFLRKAARAASLASPGGRRWPPPPASRA